jgi:hypothetical protein
MTLPAPEWGGFGHLRVSIHIRLSPGRVTSLRPTGQLTPAHRRDPSIHLSTHRNLHRGDAPHL